MRLTLRTLLAWLDDTLPPSQVREIGKQVSESPFAQELVERIHRVNRQRRLTVPSKSSPEGTDPNIVAGYVDNDLDPDQVTDYEKKCLTSDVNLAEAASVHQILSQLGQKVHVPPEAKARMGQLVKGREGIPKPQTDGAKPRTPEPVTKPIQAWVAPEPPPRHWLERFGPALACLGLIALLCWSAYHSLTPSSSDTVAVAPAPAQPSPEPRPEETPKPSLVDMTEGPVKPTPETPGAVEIVRAPDTETPDVSSTPARPETGTPKPASTPDTGKSKSEERPPARTIPAGAVGVVHHTGGVLLRFNNEKREWERIAEGTALGTGDHLICLAPFQARVVLGKAVVRLIGETQVRVLTKGPGESPAFELLVGRAVIDGLEATGPIRVDASGQSLVLERPSQGSVGLEHTATWTYGRVATGPPPLAVHASEGELNLSLGQAKRVLAGPGSVLADAAGKFQAVDGKTVPSWVTETEPSEKDRGMGEEFARQFSQDVHVLADVVAATENESAVTKKYAILAVKALGDLTFLTPILSRAKDPSARQSATTALREFLAQGPEAAKKLLEPLNEEFGERPARVIEKLLKGYTADEAAAKETVERLVEFLSPRDQSLAVRELALENLRILTGRKEPAYDPENPDEKSFSAWKSLLSKGDLKPADRRKPGG
jgi:hypothetical protein